MRRVVELRKDEGRQILIYCLEDPKRGRVSSDPGALLEQGYTDGYNPKVLGTLFGI